MNRTPLEQAFEVCQKSKTAWLNAKAGLVQAEMALRERELTVRPWSRKKYRRCAMPPT